MNAHDVLHEEKKKNAHDVLREEKKKRAVRVVSEDELEELGAAPLTTEGLFDEFQPIVKVVLDFPDGSERVVKVRRINNAEAFAGSGVYAFLQDDGKIEATLTKDEKVELDIKIKRQLVVVGLEDPAFKFVGTDSKGYPVETLGGVYLNLFFDAVNEVNNPKEVQEFLRKFRQEDEDGAGEDSDVDVGEEGESVSQETVGDDSTSAAGVDVSTSGDGTG